MTPAVGEALPDLERTIKLSDMVAYAGATWDWHRLHYDHEYLAEKALPAPVVDGQVFGALLVEQLQDWLGPDAFVTSLSFRFANLVFAGETVRCTGTVTEVDAGVVTTTQRVVVVAADGTEDRAAVSTATATATATVRLAGPGAGQP